VQSENVVGLLEGSDPKLKGEVVVLSAHLDHLGITPPIDGDSINNGALDNAAGVATTLEVAKLFRAHGETPRRSLLFLIDTAEEKGLVGAEYFAHNPTVPATSTVADVDLDMPILTYEFTDVVAFVDEREAVARPDARRGHLHPLGSLPLRRAGRAGGVSDHRFRQWRRGGLLRLHGASLSQTERRPEFAAALRCGCQIRPPRLNYEITRELADNPVKPSWNLGDFFGGKFGKP
jgi:hypothetical protein